MATLNDVYSAIKWMSRQQFNSRPSLEVHNLSYELHCSTESIMPMLRELKEMRLIKFDGQQCQSIKLTMLGNAVDGNKP